MLATNSNGYHRETVKPDLTIMRETQQLVGLSISRYHEDEMAIFDRYTP